MPDCAHLIPAYLRAVLHVVTSPLPGGSSTHMPMLPRGLRVLTAGTGDYRVGEVLTLDQACAHAPVVAVCGASGSGRSYLAHSRVAQETRTAQRRLRFVCRCWSRGRPGLRPARTMTVSSMPRWHRCATWDGTPPQYGASTRSSPAHACVCSWSPTDWTRCRRPIGTGRCSA